MGYRTEYLKNEIAPLATKNGRDTSKGGNGVSKREKMERILNTSKILNFPYIVEKISGGREDKELYLLNLTANEHGAVLVSQVTVYLMQNPGRTSIEKAYSATPKLEEWKGKNILKDYTGYSKVRAVAREGLLGRRVKGIARDIKEYIIKVLETEEEEQVREQREWAEREKDGMGRECDRWARDRQVGKYEEWVRDIRREVQVRGITTPLLTRMIRDLVPGQQPGRKDKILGDLIRRYNLLAPVWVDEGHAGTQAHGSEQGAVANNIYGAEGQSQAGTGFQPSNHKNPAIASAIDKVAINANKYTNQIRRNLVSYKDKDNIDTRQRAMMMRVVSPLPSMYEAKSVVSPRVYSKDVDNLAACRKEMRLHALKGLGAIDVDLKSCHSYLLAYYFPGLLSKFKKALEEDSLWQLYANHFEEKNQPFIKKAVKPMHYATVLGGGLPALTKSISKFVGDAITDAKAFIDTFRSTSIYKELKSLLRHLTGAWASTTLVLCNQEELVVNTSKTEHNNLLTALAAFLQNIETLIMTAVINEVHPYVEILLWQHDGLTVIPKVDNWQELLQQALDKACHDFPGLKNKKLLFTFDPIP